MILLTESKKEKALCDDCVIFSDCKYKDAIDPDKRVNYCTFYRNEEDLKKMEEPISAWN